MLATKDLKLFQFLKFFFKYIPNSVVGNKKKIQTYYNIIL